MKKSAIRIFSAVVALLLLLVSLSACGETVSKKPDVAILNAIDTTQKLAASGNTFSEKMSKGYTMEATLNISDLLSSVVSAVTGGIGMSLSSKVELKAKGIMDLEKPGYFASVDLMLNDASFVNINEYLTKNEMVLESDALLGKKSVGISFAGLADLIKNAGTGESVEMPENVNVEEAFNAYRAFIQFFAENGEKLEKIVDKYQKLLIESLFETCEATRTTETVTIGDETVEAVVFTTDISDEDALKVLRKVYDALKADTETLRLLEDAAKAVGISDEEISNFYTELEKEFARIETTGETATFRIEIAAKRGNILRCSVKTEEENVIITFGVNPADPQYAGIESEQFDIIYRVTENNGTSRTAMFTVTKEDKTAATVTVTMDSQTGSYTCTANIEDVTIILKGTAKTDKNSCTFTMDEITVNGITVKIGLTIKITAGKEAIPETPEYKDLSKMSEDEMAALQMELANNAKALLQALPTDLQFLLSGVLN